MSEVLTTEREVDKYKGTYILKPYKKTYLETIDPKHDGAILFGKASIGWSPEIDKDSGMIKTGMTKQEAQELETSLNLKPGSLSPYNRDFWGASWRLYPQVDREGVKLNLDNSDLDKLRYLYCKAHSKVSLNELEASQSGICEMIMTNGEIESKQESKRMRTKMDAMKKLADMSTQEQIDFLKVYEEGKFKVSLSSKPDFILAAIGKIAEDKPTAFLELTKNPDFKTMVFLQDCVSQGIVKKVGSQYYSTGGDKFGNTFLEAIQNIQKPEYNEVLISLKAKQQK